MGAIRERRSGRSSMKKRTVRIGKKSHERGRRWERMEELGGKWKEEWWNGGKEHLRKEEEEPKWSRKSTDNNKIKWIPAFSDHLVFRGAIETNGHMCNRGRERVVGPGSDSPTYSINQSISSETRGERPRSPYCVTAGFGKTKGRRLSGVRPRVTQTPVVVPRMTRSPSFSRH